MFKTKCLALATLLAVPHQAFASDWVLTAKVRNIEVSYAPNVVDFTIDQAAGTCPADNLLWFNAQGSDNVAKASSYSAVLAALLTAKATGSPVTIFGNNSGCTVTNIYISPAS